MSGSRLVGPPLRVDDARVPLRVAGGRGSRRRRAAVARWSRCALMAGLTALVLVPVLPVLTRAVVVPGPTGSGATVSFEGVLRVLGSATGLIWLGNSAAVAAATVAATLLIAAPGGYALSRARGRAVSAYALAVFVLQAVPLLLFVVPLFVLFAGLGLVDSLPGVTIILIGLAVPIAVWTLAASFDGVPVALEEAAWLDGLTVFGGFCRVVLRNALPGVLSTTVLTFLLAWNDYLLALVFLHEDADRTFGIAVVAGGGPAVALVAVLPPLLVFAVLHRWFRFGGIGGALTGT